MPSFAPYLYFIKQLAPRRTARRVHRRGPGGAAAGGALGRAAGDHGAMGRCAAVEPLEARQLLTVLPAGFAETQVGTSDFVSPTAMTLAPDGRIFVAEQAGQLRVIKNGTILPTPFLTVSTDTENERGLVGVEVDPNFATNHFVYVTYIATEPDFHLRLSRFTANGDVAAAGSETILYETVPMRTSFHIGGAIHFGPDGKL